MAHEALHIDALLNLEHTIAGALFDGRTYPWEVLPALGAFVRVLGRALPPDEYREIAPEVWACEDTSIAASASITGPCIIDHGAEIRHCAFIRGNVIIGRGAVVGNSTELKNALLFDGVQVPHYNYIGDSILGYRAHMGAGSITSNVKSDKRLVTVRTDAERIETGLKKFGAILGDHVEIGCNAVLCPGSVVGRDSIVYPVSRVRGVIAARHIYKSEGIAVPMRDEGEEA